IYLGGLWDGLLFLLLGVDLLLAPGPRDMTVERDIDPRLSLGVENAVTIRATSLGEKGASIVVRDDYPPAFDSDARTVELVVPPGGEAEAVYRVKPHRRGDETFLDLHVEVAKPLGLARRAIHVPSAQEVKVYPNLLGVERLKLLARRQRLSD